MPHWIDVIFDENTNYIESVIQLIYENNLLTKEDEENFESDYDYERIAETLYNNYLEKYVDVYPVSFRKSSDALRFIETTVIPRMVADQQEIAQNEDDFNNMLNEIDEEIHRKQEEMDELKKLRREMRKNPPPAPKPLPKYIDDPKNRFRMMKTKLANQIPILMKPYRRFKIKTPEDEAKDLINNTNTNSNLQFSNSVLMIQEPENEELCYEKLREVKSGFNKDKLNVRFDEPVANYYINNLNSLDAINTFLNKLYDQEIKIGAFKIQVSTGAILEENLKTAENEEIEPVYHIAPPKDDDAEKRIPLVVKDQKSLELFKDYLLSYLINNIQERTRKNTKIKPICYYTMMFHVYRLSKSGAKLPGLEEFIKSKSINVYTEDDNLCMFASYAFFKEGSFKDSRKAGQAARRYFKDFYPSATKEVMESYQGFNIASELDDFCNHFKVNTRIYQYNKDKKYYLADERFFNSEYKQFNILIVNVLNKSHVMYIKNVENLTGLLFCDKCGDLICRKSAKHSDKALKNHMKSCDGKPGVHKRLDLDRVPQPYVPHILKNKEYMELLAIGKENEYKPISSYITYDFETVEASCDIQTEHTQITSTLHPISIASVIHIPTKENKIFYFDIRDGEDFVIQWLNALIADLPDGVHYIIGYNSAKFDINLLLPEISKHFTVNSLLGSASAFKQVVISKDEITLKFIDAMLFVSPGPLKQFIKDFGSEGCSEKGIFPYEAITMDNYNEVLSKSEPFTPEDFHSELNQSDISAKDYAIYLEDAKNFESRWDYLKHYNILDVEAMISPLDNLINLFWEHKIDMLKNLSLSANASAIKYAKCYDDFKLDGDYSIHESETGFVPTKEWFERKCKQYKDQDVKANRDVSKNISEEDYDQFSKIYTPRCYLCNEKFTNTNLPTFDRINNNHSHTIDNIKFACKYCNSVRADSDENIAKLKIQLRKYCLKYDLPMTLCKNDEEAYKVIRNGITGGLSNVMHRVNIKGSTKINKFKYDIDNKTVVSYNTDNIMTHVLGIDFNSLYPSSYSSNENTNNPYTGGKMFMPGRILSHVITDTAEKKRKALAVIHSNNRFSEKYGKMFIAEIKGHIPEKYYPEFINFPPIFRRLNVETNRETIGNYMYDYMKTNQLPHDKKEEKLTMLLSTHEQYMSFSSYYLWFLIDTCHFVIDDVKSIIYFTKHDRFNKFVKTFTNERIKNIGVSKGRELFCKTCLNGSYGYDAKNTEKYTKSSIKNKDQTYLCQVFNNFVSTRKMTEDKYILTYNPKSYKCDTPVQEAYFTLDNAKFWYLNFVYNFMYKCLDMNKIHFIEGDTDSMYFAIAGDPNEGNDQMFKYVIKDQEFYDNNVYSWMPDPDKDVYDEKKILGLAVEKYGDNCVALAPKCYTIWNNNGQTKSLKLKGVSLKKNKIISSDYREVIQNENVKSGRNISLQLKNGQMSKVFVSKNALTMTHTKMIVLQNQSCAPYIHGLTAQDYKVE